MKPSATCSSDDRQALAAQLELVYRFRTSVPPLGVGRPFWLMIQRERAVRRLRKAISVAIAMRLRSES